MKIALAQQNYTIGDFKSNKEKIVRVMLDAPSVIDQKQLDELNLIVEVKE